ncbi:ATP-binding cassette domain-containing protein [Brevibacillus laterosporus]|uniref:ATP-binding cassette domain-containing protein n=2 Tax=Brevibacillus laterosporus TaxID=1465 RepID=UPI003CF619D6
MKKRKEHKGNDKVKTYSLGMKQRLGIAQSLLNNPRIVILDEPANGLDPMGMRELRELITRLKESLGITFFIAIYLMNFKKNATGM